MNEKETTANQEPNPTATVLPKPDTRRRAGDLALGLFSAIAAICFLGAWMWLKDEPLTVPPQKFNVQFHDVAGLNSNGAVYINGVRVGAVEKIILRGKNNVLVKLKISDEHVRIPEGAKFDIFSNGAVGAKYVEITLPDQGGKLLDEKSIVLGTDPIRTEFVIRKLAHELEQMDLATLEQQVHHGMHRVATAADAVAVLSKKLNPAATRAAVMEERVTALATEMQGTAKRLNRMLDDPAIAHDLKVTAQKARETAERVNIAMTKLDGMLGDQELRHDVVAALQNINQTADHIQNAVSGIESMTKDEAVRSDVKEIIKDAKQTMEKVEHLVSVPEFGHDVKGTLGRAKWALTRLGIVAKQLSQVLDKRAPLLHLLIGRPGKLEPEQTAGTNESIPD